MGTGLVNQDDPATWRVNYIYGLTDPETGAVRYIGKSIRPLERFANHMNEKSNCHRSHWLQSLKARGLEPGLVIFEEVSGAWPWQEAERYWIARGRRLGWPLTNNTSGGDGVPDLHPEARAKIATTWKGRKHTPETLEKMRVASASRRHTPETKALMSRRHKGRKITWTDKLSEAVRKLSPDDVAAIRARLDAGERVKNLAAEYGVHRTTMSKVKKGKYP